MASSLGCHPFAGRPAPASTHRTTEDRSCWAGIADHVSTLGIALLDGGKIIWSQTFGEHADGAPLYQAASLSKIVTAVLALKLVEQGILSLDKPVDLTLTSWKSARPPWTNDHPVTLRWLLSMRAGMNVPGFIGYPLGSPIPSLLEILKGERPANSPPIEVVATPGQRYSYSGGGYEVVEALIDGATRRSFADVAKDLVLAPVGMAATYSRSP